MAPPLALKKIYAVSTLSNAIVFLFYLKGMLLIALMKKPLGCSLQKSNNKIFFIIPLKFHRAATKGANFDVENSELNFQEMFGVIELYSNKFKLFR